MSTARPFELRIIRQHMVRRWLAWGLFLFASQALGSPVVFAIGILVLAVFSEQRWPLPHVQVFGLRLPPNLLSWALALLVGWLTIKSLVPVLGSQMIDTVLRAVFVAMLVLFLCTQVQLLRGRRLA